MDFCGKIEIFHYHLCQVDVLYFRLGPDNKQQLQSCMEAKFGLFFINCKTKNIFQNSLLHIFCTVIDFREHFFGHPYHFNAVSFTFDGMLSYRKQKIVGNITVILYNYPRNG